MSLQSAMKSAGKHFENPGLDLMAQTITKYFQELPPRPTRKSVLFGIAKLRSLHADILKYWADASAIVQKSGDNDAMVTVRRAQEICKRHDAMIRSLMKQFNVAAHQCARCGQDTDEATAQCPGCNAKMDNHVHENLRAAAAAEPTQDFDLNVAPAKARLERARKSKIRLF